ncbi:MAG: SRPBCC domain-containing protein [Acidobacteria bacterium]|nr:SRPBCC domain-containing protein [Acidobacteriota bacterium]
MKVTYQPDQEFTSAAAKKATGRTIEEWFAALDAKGGIAQGRRALGDYLFKECKVDAWWTATLNVEYEKARGAVEKDSCVRGYGICVTKSVTAPPARIYDALTGITAWMGPKTKFDLKEGGAFDDGDGHSGIFKRLAPGKTMKFTWTGHGHQNVEEVEIKFTVTGAMTSIVLNHTRLPDRTAADGMRAAWAKALDIIKDKVA